MVFSFPWWLSHWQITKIFIGILCIYSPFIHFFLFIFFLFIPIFLLSVSSGCPPPPDVGPYHVKIGSRVERRGFFRFLRAYLGSSVILCAIVKTQAGLKLMTLSGAEQRLLGRSPGYDCR